MMQNLSLYQPYYCNMKDMLPSDFWLELYNNCVYVRHESFKVINYIGKGKVCEELASPWCTHSDDCTDEELERSLNKITQIITKCNEKKIKLNECFDLLSDICRLDFNHIELQTLTLLIVHDLPLNGVLPESYEVKFFEEVQSYSIVYNGYNVNNINDISNVDDYGNYELFFSNGDGLMTCLTILPNKSLFKSFEITLMDIMSDCNNGSILLRDFFQSLHSFGYDILIEYE